MSLIAERIRSIGEPDQSSAAEIKDLLQAMKKDKTPRSDIIVKYGGYMLERYSSELGSDIWQLYEDVAIAALDEDDAKLADSCVKRLKGRFGETSMRVRRLIGMQCEASGKFAEAKRIYESVLEENPANQLVKKRLVSILCAQGKRKEAIATLVEHIKLCANDMFAWQKLAILYVSVGAYENAAFCYEELMTLAPREPLYHTMYAELVYAIGRDDPEKLRTARQYFSLSVDSKFQGTSSNTRALVGIAMSAAALSKVSAIKKTKEKSSSEDKKLNAALHKFSLENLRKAYASSPVAAYAMRVLERQAKGMSEK